MIGCYSAIMGRHNKDSSFQAPEAATLIDQAAGLLRKCKNRARSLKVSRPTKDVPSPAAGLAPPSREMADELARLYFGSFESTSVSLKNCPAKTEGC
jgi:hypothetical protein